MTQSARKFQVSGQLLVPETLPPAYAALLALNTTADQRGKVVLQRHQSGLQVLTCRTLSASAGVIASRPNGILCEKATFRAEFSVASRGLVPSLSGAQPNRVRTCIVHATFLIFIAIASSTWAQAGRDRKLSMQASCGAAEAASSLILTPTTNEHLSS
jgi:hypothetical protein